MKKNILFLIESLKNGGSERAICNIANEISKYHNVILVVANKESEYKFIGNKIIEIKEFLSKNPFKRIKGINKLKKIKKEYTIDITISFLTAYNFYNAFSKVNDKIYISVRNHLSTKKESLLARLSTIYSNKKADRIICVSNSVKEDLIHNYKAQINKIIVIENFTCIHKKNNIDKKNVIVTVGRLTTHKGQEHIIKAISIVKEKFNDIQLLIIGRGKTKKYLSKLVNLYKLQKNIKFVDFDTKIEKYLNKSKIFVLASDYEGFSNSLLEAMTCSLPVIATNSPGGNNELLKDGKYGILIPSFSKEHNLNFITENEKKLAQEIISLLKDTEKYNLYSNKAKIRSKDYSKDIIMKKWISIIEEKNEKK